MKSENTKVYGPYLGKDKRRRVVIRKGKKLRTMSYAKYLLSKKLGKKAVNLLEDIIVHHINGNSLDDRLENYEPMSRAKHGKLHNPKKKKEFQCPQCGGIFLLIGSRLSHHKSNKKRKKSYIGPFCCKECAGKYSAIEQWGRGETGIRTALKTRRGNP